MGHSDSLGTSWDIRHKARMSVHSEGSMGMQTLKGFVWFYYLYHLYWI